MRISGGKACGIPLRVSQKSSIRPAMETTRERIFSSLQNTLDEARVLDLFAGSGAYGLEALSRGASEATMVEKNFRVFGDLKVNLAAVLKSAELQGTAGILINRNVLDFLQTKPELPYDLIFIDPPYSEIDRIFSKIFELFRLNEFLAPNGQVIFETPGEFLGEHKDWQLDRIIGKEKRGSPVHRVFIPSHPRSGQ